MTNKIKILPSIENRYVDPKIYKPIAKANYNQFIKNVDNFIKELNNILKTNDGLYCVLYDGLCMNINHDLMNFKNLTKDDLNLLLEKTMFFIVEFYSQLEREVTGPEEEKIESVFKFFELSLKNYKGILDYNSGSEDKMRGILMEALGVSVFGNIDCFVDNFFIWDFNAYEENEKIKFGKRETADIYFEENSKAYVCEIKCRPRGVDESQIDFINYLNTRMDNVENLMLNKIILHGGTADDYNFETVNYKQKLKNFMIYPKENIKELLKKI